MSRRLVLFILISSPLVILPIFTASSQLISCDEPIDNFNVEVSNSATYISVPFHYQNNNYYCGPAALEMVFDYYGEAIPQTEIADVARTYPNVTFTDELRRAAHFSNVSTSLGDEMPGNITGYSTRKIGYAAFEQWGLTIDDLKTLTNKGKPLIVLMWWTPSKVYGHYRVVVGYNETHIIMHDPWNKKWGGLYGGANVSMTYSTFLDLWEYIGYWGLLVCPWDIEPQMLSTVSKGDDFEVTANITYPCSAPFDTADYPASYCNATIKLPEGLELALGETTQHYLGDIVAGNFVQTSWSIHASEGGFHNISVTVTGIIEGSVEAHKTYPSYHYDDAIGGSCTNLLSILNVRNIDTGLDYASIQKAINANETKDGHTIFVEEGTYEHVVVNKTVSLLGECRSTTIIDGNGTDIVVDVRANDTVISGFTIQNSGSYEPASGIRLYRCFNSSVSNNNANNNHKAIYLFVCVNCFVNGNTASNSGVGIRLDRSSNCYIFDNNANINGHGIFIDSSSNITLRKNNMTGNSYNFGVQGSFLQEHIHDIDVSNTVNGKPIIYWINQTDKPVPANAGYVGIVNSTSIVVENLTLTRNVDGVLFAHTTNSSIQEVATNNNFHGILLDDSRNCFVHDNNVTDNKYGIGLRRSCSCCVFGNNVSSNDYGIELWFSGSSVYDNNINNNSVGLGLSGSAGCSVYNNTATNNKFGVKIEHSSNDTIYHNNFINNTSQVYTEYSMNVWDDGYPSGGNYWSDYEERYPNATEIDYSGIWDTPYVIDENNQDNYPIVPEFPSFLTLPLFMIATLLAVLIHRRKHSM